MSSPPPVPPKDIPPRRSSLERQEEDEPRARQRSGYTRPFPPTAFSSSAMHRHSVLALGKNLRIITYSGKIEHLQHYFAVSGKLDKKGLDFAVLVLMLEPRMRQLRPSRKLTLRTRAVVLRRKLWNRKFRFHQKEIPRYPFPLRPNQNR
jgi:hypothetical protein